MTEPSAPSRDTVTSSSVTSPIAVPSFGSKGHFAALAETKIKGPIDIIFSTILNVGAYSKWNSFVPKVEVVSTPKLPRAEAAQRVEVGSALRMHVYMKGKGSVKEHLSIDTVSFIEELKDGRKGHSVAWTNVIISKWLLRAERVQEVWEEPSEPAVVRYKTWVTIGGPLTYLMTKSARKDLADRLEDVARDLQNYIEGNETSNVPVGEEVVY